MRSNDETNEDVSEKSDSTMTTQNSKITANQPSLSKVGRDTAGVTTVTYTSKGFSPFIVEVEAGEQVKFVNESDSALWPTANGHPTATDQFYPSFDAGKSLKKGESYSFVFNDKGVWGYKNLNNENHLGTIVVTSQK